MLYAVGDIHGEREMLQELLAKLPLQTGDRLVFMGDYVDRGPDSKGVVDTRYLVFDLSLTILAIGLSIGVLAARRNA